MHEGAMSANRAHHSKRGEHGEGMGALHACVGIRGRESRKASHPVAAPDLRETRHSRPPLSHKPYMQKLKPPILLLHRCGAGLSYSNLLLAGGRLGSRADSKPSVIASARGESQWNPTHSTRSTRLGRMQAKCTTGGKHNKRRTTTLTDCLVSANQSAPVLLEILFCVNLELFQGA